MVVFYVNTTYARRATARGSSKFATNVTISLMTLIIFILQFVLHKSV